MKRLVRILILFFVIAGLVYVNDGIKSDPAYGTYREYGSLLVDFYVPKGKPIFKLYDMKPGDYEQRKVYVKNKGNVSKKIYVVGIRKGGAGSDPKIESVLEITIKDGNNILYGPKKLSQFFADSKEGSGIFLNKLYPWAYKTYYFMVDFPVLAGNEFQRKSVIFDLTFAAADS